MQTSELISELTDGVHPVRRLYSPQRRLCLWLVLSLPVVAAAVAIISPRPDLLVKVVEARFLLEQAAALATAVAAALAALTLVAPGWPRWMVTLPALPAAVWLGTLGAGCVADWRLAGAAGLRMWPEPACLGYIAGIGLVPALVLVVMVRRGAPLAPRTTLFLAGLASAALANFGLRLFHDTDAGLMVLAWQFGSVLLLSLAAGLAGTHLLRWPHGDRRA